MSTRQQNTTTYPVNFFMVLSVDHVTPATGKVVTLTRSKNGAAFGAATGAVSEIANGWYSWAGNATDRDTLGELLMHGTAAGTDAVDLKIDITAGDYFSLATDGSGGLTVGVFSNAALEQIKNVFALLKKLFGC